jgi:inorganic pyrophosphatase
MTQESSATIEVFIEIPLGSRNKYEWDKRRRVLKLDRVLYASVHYPADYGFVPDTLAEDGDPLDVLVLAEEPVVPGCLVDVRPVGVLHMLDNGAHDRKVLAVQACDPRLSHLADLEDVPPHWLREIENFFNTYKDLEGGSTLIQGWEGRETALAIVRKAQLDFIQSGASS